MSAQPNLSLPPFPFPCLARLVLNAGRSIFTGVQLLQTLHELRATPFIERIELLPDPDNPDGQRVSIVLGRIPKVGEGIRLTPVDRTGGALVIVPQDFYASLGLITASCHSMCNNPGTCHHLLQPEVVEVFNNVCTHFLQLHILR